MAQPSRPPLAISPSPALFSNEPNSSPVSSRASVIAAGHGLRRDDETSAVQRRDHGRGGARRAAAVFGEPVRSGSGGRVLRVAAVGAGLGTTRPPLPGGHTSRSRALRSHSLSYLPVSSIESESSLNVSRKRSA